MPDQLAWPPRREDLERMYVEEGMSAMKIAEAYGLKYASRKTAESTVLYHLKMNGIRRRDAAEVTRKATPELVDEWVRRYEAGESLKQIAGELVDPVTVWNHLRKRGVVLRDKVEAQIAAVTLHHRTAFSGDESERAYLLGFVWGDCAAQRHGRAIRVRSGSTHPDFISLFDALFGGYGRVRHYPRRARLAEAEMNVEVDLDNTFTFLLEKYGGKAPRLPLRGPHALQFLSGFMDAEGTIYWHKKLHPAFEVQIATSEAHMAKWVSQVLSTNALHPSVSFRIQQRDRIQGSPASGIWHIAVTRHSDVTWLLESLELRHPEKVQKARVALGYNLGNTALGPNGSPERWAELRENIDKDKHDFMRNLLATLDESG